MDTTVLTTQALGLTTTLFLSGFSFSASQLPFPHLYTVPPSISTPFFSEIYFRGAFVVVPMGLFSSACSAYAAYALPSQRSVYLLAAGLTFATLPWTVLVMGSTNQRLLEISKNHEKEKADVKEVETRLRFWYKTNLMRAALYLSSGLVGIWGLVGEQL